MLIVHIITTSHRLIIRTITTSHRLIVRTITPSHRLTVRIITTSPMLIVRHNNVTQTDCTYNNNVTRTDCTYNNNVTQTDCTYNNNVTQTDCTYNNNVTHADCTYNNVTQIDRTSTEVPNGHCLKRRKNADLWSDTLMAVSSWRLNNHRALVFLLLYYCLQNDIAHFKEENRDRVCLCLCLSVRVSLSSDSSETVIMVNLGTVTASDTRMHHVLIMLTLTFIQGHTDRNHENNKCLIISETVQSMLLKFAVNMVRLKVCMTVARPMTLTFIQGHKCVNLQYFGQYLNYNIQTWHDLWMPYTLILVLWPWPWCKVTVGRQKRNNQRCMLSTTEQAMCIKIAAEVGHFTWHWLNVYKVCPACFVFLVLFFLFTLCFIKNK